MNVFVLFTNQHFIKCSTYHPCNATTGRGNNINVKIQHLRSPHLDPCPFIIHLGATQAIPFSSLSLQSNPNAEPIYARPMHTQTHSLPILRQPPLAFPLPRRGIGRCSHRNSHLLAMFTFIGIHNSITVTVSTSSALQLMWSPCNRRSHLDFLLLLADISLSEQRCSHPSSNNKDNYHDEHNDPLVMRIQPSITASSRRRFT